MLDQMFAFLQKIYDFFLAISEAVDETSMALYQIEFTSNPMLTYIGYFHYVVGTLNFRLFTTILLIGGGIALFTFFFKGFHWIRQFLPI